MPAQIDLIGLFIKRVHCEGVERKSVSVWSYGEEWGKNMVKIIHCIKLPKY